MSEDDGIEQIIGPFGRYQTFIFILIAIGRYPVVFQLTNVVFILPQVEFLCLDEGANNQTNYCPCSNPEYIINNIVGSVTSEFNLICDRSNLASIAQSMLQIGILGGSVIFGYSSDRFGRKFSSVLALFLCALSVTVSAFVTEFWMFLVCRFIIGSSVGGTMLCCYVLIIEMCGKSFRPYMIGIHEIPYITGYFLLGIIASFVREWRYLQLITSTPWLIVIVYFWIIPESPRWLITAGRKEEAIKLLTYIANKNNRPKVNITEIVNDIERQAQLELQQRGTFVDLFKTPKIRKYSFTMAVVWLCCTLAYFGINQFIGNLGGNLYINVMLSATSLLPGTILVAFATFYLKRKVTVTATFLIAAISLFATIFIPAGEQVATLVFAIIGLMGAYTSFVQIYLYTSEIFPTVVRNSAMGFCSVFARFGGFIAPFVVNIGTQWKSSTIFSGTAALTALLCLFLPETKDVVLLHSLKQVEG